MVKLGPILLLYLPIHKRGKLGFDEMKVFWGLWVSTGTMPEEGSCGETGSGQAPFNFIEKSSLPARGKSEGFSVPESAL